MNPVHVYVVAAMTLLPSAALLGKPTPAELSKATVLATYAPRPQIPAEVRARHLSGAGICVVYLRPDGTVSRATMLRSTGQAILDKVTIDAFSKWRFKPTTIKKVKIPIAYTGNYRQALQSQ